MVEEGAARVSVSCPVFQPQTHIFHVHLCMADVVIEVLVAFDTPCKSELQLGFGFASLTHVFLCDTCVHPFLAPPPILFFCTGVPTCV